MDINTPGTMIGKIVDTSNYAANYPFIYSGSGLVSPLVDLPLFQFHAINDANAVAATARFQGNQYGRACVYDNGTVTYLSGSNSNAYDINNSNHVLGEDGSGGFWLWNDGTKIPVGLRRTTGEFGNSGLNDFDVVVGYVDTLERRYAAVWQDGVTRILDSLIDPALGLHLYSGFDINNKGEILCNGNNGSNSYWYLLVPDTALVIRDAKNDIIPNVAFSLIKVANDPPFFTEDTLGSFTTDSDGRLKMTRIGADTLAVSLSTGTKKLVIGDSLKIAKHVQSVPAAKHTGVLGTMYSVHLDNARFGDDGHVYFDRLTGGCQDIVLNHTELRYNLLVSVGWEATYDYLLSLEDNFVLMSDYLYDVTDGQLRLDTVYIIDNGAFQSSADVIVYASNFVWPCANAGGILTGGATHIYMPRIWMGDSTSSRNYTDRVYPLNLTAWSGDYRTKAHEFGHYALGFFDEYLFRDLLPFIYTANDSRRCVPPNIFNYGFMDRPYEGTGVMSSEMSGAFRYEMESCRNTNQWGVHGMSCWDHFERWVEAVPWGTDNLNVPILKPSLTDQHERIVTEPGVFFTGPNNNLSSPNYHVGLLIEFPHDPSVQSPGYSDKHVTVNHPRGGSNASLRLINDAGTGERTMIYEGRTSDAAGAWVVGIKDADYQILVSKGPGGDQPLPAPAVASPAEVTTDWLYGIAQSDGSKVSRIGNRFVSNSTGDSLSIDLNQVHGYYPLICSADLTATGTQYTLISPQAFSEIPTLELWPSYGGMSSHSCAATDTGYAVSVADSLGPGGEFTLWAKDDSAAAFFVPTTYVAPQISHDQPNIWLLGTEGQCEFKLDSSNTSVERALILSSPFPVVRTGLNPNAVQAGQAHSLSVYPATSVSGANQVVIRYDDADLQLSESDKGDESTLGVYRWAGVSTGWQSIGGTVDTAANEIYAAIPMAGVYAAFTSTIITDVRDDGHGENLPYRFELSQNYPNPFNPTTTIEYSVPSRTDVRIEIFNVLGQKVRTLVNESKAAGSYRVEWNGFDHSGNPVSTGVYLYRFQAGDVVQTKKMLLIK